MNLASLPCHIFTSVNEYLKKKIIFMIHKNIMQTNLTAKNVSCFKVSAVES